jgi:hypothetical protein
MEMASFLAGERWSDHPRCTHPVLATMARCTNDSLGDEARQELAVMIPEVVGLNPDDPRVAAALVRCAATAALPVASAERQNIMALAVLAAERNLSELEGRPDGSLRPASRAALSSAPLAERWAREFGTRSGVRPRRFSTAAASSVVALAIDGIARACVEDPQARLISLLREAIDETKRLAESTVPVVPVPSRPVGVHSLLSR